MRSYLKQLSRSLVNGPAPFIKRGLNHASTRAVLGVFLSQRCPVCDRPADGHGHRTPFCIDCHRQITSVCYPVKGWELMATNGMAIGALGEYRGTLKQAILALKYNNGPEVASNLGAALAQRWLGQSNRMQAANLYAVPIPLHPNRLAKRGYNQAELIADAFCRVSSISLLSHGLIRAQDTLPQHQLGLEARQNNLEAAFTIGKSLQRVRHRSQVPPQFLLVDDIYTTGATARSAAQTLTNAGLKVVGMLTLARAVND